ncbi:MAG: hypothetical protein ACI8SE_001822 [Bacteroidia bacterium]|jgi:hypothetical protein
MNKRSALIGMLVIVAILAAIGITKLGLKTKTIINTTFEELETQFKQDSSQDPLNFEFVAQTLYNNTMLLDLKSDMLVDQIE